VQRSEWVGRNPEVVGVVDNMTTTDHTNNSRAADARALSATVAEARGVVCRQRRERAESAPRCAASRPLTPLGASGIGCSLRVGRPLAPRGVGLLAAVVRPGTGPPGAPRADRSDVGPSADGLRPQTGPPPARASAPAAPRPEFALGVTEPAICAGSVTSTVCPGDAPASRHSPVAVPRQSARRRVSSATALNRGGDPWCRHPNAKRERDVRCPHAPNTEDSAQLSPNAQHHEH
jgi:hypothetical protein